MTVDVEVKRSKVIIIPESEGNSTITKESERLISEVKNLPDDIHLNINLYNNNELGKYNATAVMDMPNVEGQRLFIKLIGLQHLYN